MPGGATSATATLIASLPYSDSSTSAMTVGTAGANASADAVAALLNGGTIRIYTAPQPASADVAVTTQTLLASPTFGTPAFAAAVAGVSTANAVIADGNAAASGTANWARFVTSGGATVYDGTVGTTPAAHCRLPSTTITIHGTVSVTSARYQSPVIDRGRWYKYLAATPAVPNELGVFVYTAGSNNLDLRVYTPDAVTPYQAGNLFPFTAIRNKPIQFPVSAGVAYYLNVFGAGNAGDYTLSVLAGATDPAPIGSIFVNDDHLAWPLVILSAIDGTPLRYISPFPIGETADILATGTYTGRILVHDRTNTVTDDRLKLYSPHFDLLADVQYLMATDSQVCPIMSNKSIRFYIGRGTDAANANHATVTTVTATGAFGATTWNLPAAGLRSLAPSVDETILYVTGQGGFLNTPVKRWDLVNAVFLSDLAAGIPNYFVTFACGMLVLNDDTILVSYENNVSENNPPMVKHYATDGSVLNTYTMTGSLSKDVRLTHALDDPASFWMWTKANTGINRFTNLRVSDGATLTTFDVTQFENGTYAGVVSATPSARFGASESCPFLILRVGVGLPPITGTIDVIAPPPNSGTVPNALALTGYPLPPRHLEALCRTIMTIAALSPDARQQMFNALGVMLSGGKLLTQEAGTTTNLATYSDSALTVANSNPVIADASGLLGPIYLLPQAYKFTLYDSNDLLQWSQDNVWDVGELLQATITTLQTQVTANLALTETKFCTTQLTMNSTATLANIVGLTGFTLAASGVYAFEINLAGTSTANGGLKIAFKYTTATLTNLEATAQGFTASAVAVQHTTTTTDQATLFGQTAAVISIRIVGRLTVNVAGTLAVQAAQNASHSDTSAIYIGSSARFTKVS